MRLQAAFARKFCGPFSARRAGTTSARFRLCNCFYRQAVRALSVVGSHGFPTVVKQVAKFQNYNLSTFKFQCSPAWRSCSCWRCSNFARPTGFRHVGEVAFSTLLRSESRTLPDNPPLSENGAKKDRLRAVRGRPFSVPVYFFSCCSCSLRSSLMRFFSLLTWGHGQLKPSLALHQRVSG